MKEHIIVKDAFKWIPMHKRECKYSPGTIRSDLKEDLRIPLLWLTSRKEGSNMHLYLVNSTDEVLDSVVGDCEGFVTEDDASMPVSSNDKYEYKNIEPNSAVLVDVFDMYYDLDYVLYSSVEIKSKKLGHIGFRSPGAKGGITESVLLWNTGEEGKDVAYFKNKVKEETIESFESIIKKLKNIDKSKVLKEMGYNGTQEGGLLKLEILDKSSTLVKFLANSRLDLLYTGEMFFLKLLSVLNISAKASKESINKYKSRNRKLNSLELPTIFVNTNFKRKSEPIFMLASLDDRRHIELSKTAVYNSRDDGLSIVKKLVKQHYKKSNGELKVWGKIVNYKYTVNGKDYVFDKNGDICDDAENIVEGKAFLSL